MWTKRNKSFPNGELTAHQPEVNGGSLLMANTQDLIILVFIDHSSEAEQTALNLLTTQSQAGASQTKGLASHCKSAPSVPARTEPPGFPNQ